MRIPTSWLMRRAMCITANRAPDFIIGGADNPYLRRWWLVPRNRFFNVYLHHFMRSDDDRALHDHPWINLSILLDGSYIEHTPRYSITRSAGQMAARGARAAHRIELLGNPLGGELPVWTLFLTGPRMRDWGFYCPKGWVPWQIFTRAGDHGQIGPGCNG
jgi:hypothetical protein